MKLGEYTATVEHDRVSIFRCGVVVGTGRWTGRRILDRPPGLKREAPQAEDAFFAALEAGLAEEGAAEVAAMQASAYDEQGVDVTLIRWMLSLSPRERLKVLDDYARSMAGLLDGRFRGQL
jgi:hypothetical protein